MNKDLFAKRVGEASAKMFPANADYWYREGFDRADHERSTRERNAKEKAAQPITGEWLEKHGFELEKDNGKGERHYVIPLRYKRLMVSFGDDYAKHLGGTFVVHFGDARVNMLWLEHIKTVGQLAAFYELVEGKPLEGKTNESTDPL